MKTRIRNAGVLLLLAAGFASASPSQVLGEADARHLLARTGFGPTIEEVRAFALLTRAQAVERLLAGARTTPVTAPPPVLLDTGPIERPGPNASVEERRAFQREQVRQGLALRAWWVGEMLVTPSPLTERMTLFWHNHFVSSQQKVRLARLMYAQNATLRSNALGNFATLLHATSREPAMLIYLDGVQNRRAQPNENFAREVMELFTLGEGHYGERDVKEAARSFTGWSLDRERGTFIFRPMQHDYGVKTVLGKSGRFDGDDVLDILLAQRATAQHLAEKLWREFASPQPNAAEIGRIAAALRDSGYEIRPALRELLTSDAFYAADARARLVKSPVDLVVGTLRQLALAPSEALPFAVSAAAMGQNLFSPPNVKGWPGGDAWIDTNTLLLRKQFLERLVRVDERLPIATAAPASAISEPMVEAVMTPDERTRAMRAAGAIDRGLRDLRFDATAWIARLPGATPEAKRSTAARLLLPLDAPPPPGDSTTNSEWLRALLLDPAFELK